MIEGLPKRSGLVLAARAETGAPYGVGAPPYSWEVEGGRKNNEAREHGLTSLMKSWTAGLGGVAACCSAAVLREQTLRAAAGPAGRREVSSIRSGYATLLRPNISALERRGS